MIKKLYNLENLNTLSIKDVRKLYEQYVNPAQSNATKVFGFGQELANKSLGQ